MSFALTFYHVKQEETLYLLEKMQAFFDLETLMLLRDWDKNGESDVLRASAA